jgi:hypothetical protein
VTVSVIVNPDTPVATVGDLDEVRERLSSAVKGLHPAITVDTMFTGINRWAAAENPEGERT